MSLKIDEILRSALLNAVTTVCLLAIYSISFAECSRADLGTYLSMKELPSQDEKITVDTVTYTSINYTYRTFERQEVHFNEEKARFGEGRVMNVNGYLVHVTDIRDPMDHTGCSEKILPSNRFQLGDHPAPWIALIQRGGCTFDDKIKNAYLNRAVGVIIYNDENSMTLEKMKILDKERNITAVFTYKWIGEEMARIVDRGTQVWVSITEGQRILKPIANINNVTQRTASTQLTSVLFVSVSFIVLMIISLVWLIFYYVQRFRYLQSKDQHSRQLCSVAKRIIGKIPTKSGKSDDSENDCCAVCIEPYKATDCIRVLPCKHEFHKNCIDPWLLEHRTCPMCKLDVLKHYGFVFIGSEESIVQLDMDVEIDGHNPQQTRVQNRARSEDSTDESISITITPPQFDDTVIDANSTSSALLMGRRSSFETMVVTRRVSIPERSASSMSHCAKNLEAYSRDLLVSATTPTKCASKSALDSNYLSLDESKTEMESKSLPSTLKAPKPAGTPCGSINSYVKSAAVDLKQLATLLEKANPMSVNSCLRKDAEKDLLLCNDKTESTTASETDPPACSMSISNASNDDSNELKTSEENDAAEKVIE